MTTMGTTSFVQKVKGFFVNIWEYLKESFERGYKWIGIDGLINMETSALLVMFFLLLFPAIWASFITLVIVVGKCLFDKRRGSDKETHDFICAIIGIIGGLILGIAHTAVVLL